MSLAELHDDWTVWSDEADRVVLVYRPDVFDGGAFPAPCLPTIYATRGERNRRPGGDRVGTDWSVTLTLEPDVQARSERYEDRADALAGATEFADEFARGDVEYRDAYQVPRPEYLDELDERTGRDAQA